MAAQALYRKWRSQSFDDVVGQEHITVTLRNALRDGRMSHAYLFTGPRGTGKTTPPASWPRRSTAWPRIPPAAVQRVPDLPRHHRRTPA